MVIVNEAPNGMILWTKTVTFCCWGVTFSIVTIFVCFLIVARIGIVMVTVLLWNPCCCLFCLFPLDGS